MSTKKKRPVKSVSPIYRVISFAVTALIAVLLFISILGRLGSAGFLIRDLFFGIMGKFYYVFPFYLIFSCFYISLREIDKPISPLKVVLIVTFFLFACLFFQVIFHIGKDAVLDPIESFELGRDEQSGGGFIGGTLGFLFLTAFGKVGAIVIDVFGIILILLVGFRAKISELVTTRKPNNKTSYKEKYERIHKSEKSEKPEKLKKETNSSIRNFFSDKTKDDDRVSRMDKTASGIDFSVLNDTEESNKSTTFINDVNEFNEANNINETNIIEPTNINESDNIIESNNTIETGESNQDYKVNDLVELNKGDLSHFEEVQRIDGVSKIDDINRISEVNDINRISLTPVANYEDIVPTPEPEPEVIFKPEPVEIVEPNPEPAEIIEPNPEPAEIIEPEPVFEPDPVSIFTPEPEPVEITELEPELVEITESEPVEVIDHNSEPVEITEPEPELAEIIDPEPVFAPDPVSIFTQEPEVNDDYNKEPIEPDTPREYVFPTPSLLNPLPTKSNHSTENLDETAEKLVDTLRNFGVEVSVSEYSRGPAVTRFEIIPSQGVKVSKILNLADDIKLNLAAPDIRIEAPIPGKSAIGIEVPNKQVEMVHFRELIENSAFTSHSSAICFAAGKDLGGNVVISDIAKMPHVLIAGQTGSGKSVCINTIIMSILYKANPDEVKFIMIDPKVVELSVYNGIPHLLIPVVSDPKKAAGALNWAVREMNERYQKFAALGVRDMTGYNKKVSDPSFENESGVHNKLYQLVVIVDELADLMMVSSSEVEESICRLAQLARAAGIHLVVATQRPSVNVITGLIKANMPSRIAFAVTSGVDSRTILDMNGAEKLLGKGDMLYFPQGLTKPLRVQGAFVTDDEVIRVTEFICKNNVATAKDNENQIEIESQMATSISDGSGISSSNAPFKDDKDEYFAEAGRFIITSEKGSIGMLQRKFKIGFNRAARIMDQLAEAGVVGPEEGTKPRKILVNLEEFENILKEG